MEITLFSDKKNAWQSKGLFILLVAGNARSLYDKCRYSVACTSEQETAVFTKDHNNIVEVQYCEG